MKLGISNKGFMRLAQELNEIFELTVLPIDDVSPTEFDQDPNIIERLTFLFQESGEWPNKVPPISLVDDEERGYVIVNGHHRWRAAQEAGLDFIPVRIFPDDPTFVDWFLNQGEQE